MLAAVANAARTLKAASIIVDVRTDLLSSKIRFDISFWVASAADVLLNDCALAMPSIPAVQLPNPDMLAIVVWCDNGWP